MKCKVCGETFPAAAPATDAQASDIEVTDEGLAAVITTRLLCPYCGATLRVARTPVSVTLDLAVTPVFKADGGEGVLKVNFTLTGDNRRFLTITTSELLAAPDFTYPEGE